jgi:probable HAF family extracellular repeat protein
MPHRVSLFSSARLSRRLTVGLLSGTCLTLSAGAAAAAGSLTLLDTGTFDRGTAYGVTDAGTAVGYAELGNMDYPVYWLSDGTQAGIPLGVLQTGVAKAITPDGGTIVGHGYDPNLGTGVGFVYHPGDLAITVLPVKIVANAEAVNAAGTVVVGNDQLPGVVTHAFMWSGQGLQTETDLGVLHVGDVSFADGVDGLGDVIVGGSGVYHTSSDGFYYKNSTMTALASGGLGATWANAISADGSTIVGVGTNDLAGLASHALRWDGQNYGTVTDLGNLGGTYSEAVAVNSDGSVIVGASTLSGGGYGRAFRYANGAMSDLNTLLAASGVDMSSITLVEANGVSANGNYITADDNSLSYLVYYDGTVGGLTTGAAQQASVDELGKQRQALAIQHDAYAGILTGDLDRQDDTNQIGALGLYGSAVGGLRGHLGLGDGWSLSGGMADGTSEFGGAGIGNGLYGAMALRYDAQDFAAGGFHPFGQVGGTYGLLSGVDMTRSYTGGTGTGSTNGTLGSVYARFGITGDFKGGDQVSFAGEIGERRLSTEAYSETLSATNPFPASIAAGTDIQTIAKFSTSWTHLFSDKFDVTLRAAVGTVIAGTSGLAVATTGFGTLGTGIDHAVWGELGAHATWKVSDHSALDLYATGIFGPTTGTNAHVGAGYHYQF